MSEPPVVSSLLVARISLALAVVGAFASVLIHGSAWLGLAAPFQATFILFVGCMFVWWRALTASWAAFHVREVKPLWKAVTDRCPWLKAAYAAMTYYFMIYFFWVLYVGVGKGAKPSPELWARFYSAGALVFYVASAAFLLAAIRAGGGADDA